MSEELKEQQEVKNKPFDPFGYVTIPVKEYRKLIRKSERARADISRLISEKYAYKDQCEELRKSLDMAKADLKRQMGLELDKKELEKLADMQFEKGVSNDAI